MSTQTYSDACVMEKTEVKTESMYQVIFHNDNTTHMEFVVLVLCEIFHKSTEEATEIMLYVHNHGKAAAGIYREEIAITKRDETMQMAKDYDQREFLVTVEQI